MDIIFSRWQFILYNLMTDEIYVTSKLIIKFSFGEKGACVCVCIINLQNCIVWILQHTHQLCLKTLSQKSVFSYWLSITWWIKYWSCSFSVVLAGNLIPKIFYWNEYLFFIKIFDIQMNYSVTKNITETLNNLSS